jgi:NAD(P)-dependent dehydrogenase (short-subunit alcohol dehydrogenase family)
MTIEADLARDESIDEIVAKARGRFGVIDILVNNAGVGQATIRSETGSARSKFWEVTPEQWKLFVAVHNNAPMALSRAVAEPALQRAETGAQAALLGAAERQAVLVEGDDFGRMPFAARVSTLLRS